MPVPVVVEDRGDDKSSEALGDRGDDEAWVSSANCFGVRDAGT